MGSYRRAEYVTSTSSRVARPISWTRTSAVERVGTACVRGPLHTTWTIGRSAARAPTAAPRR